MVDYPARVLQFLRDVGSWTESNTPGVATTGIRLTYDLPMRTLVKYSHIRKRIAEAFLPSNQEMSVLEYVVRRYPRSSELTRIKKLHAEYVSQYELLANNRDPDFVMDYDDLDRIMVFLIYDTTQGFFLKVCNHSKPPLCVNIKIAGTVRQLWPLGKEADHEVHLQAITISDEIAYEMVSECLDPVDVEETAAIQFDGYPLFLTDGGIGVMGVDPTEFDYLSTHPIWTITHWIYDEDEGEPCCVWDPDDETFESQKHDGETFPYNDSVE